MPEPFLSAEKVAQLAVCASTDAQAFAGLYDAFFDRVYSYLRYRLDDAATADDLTALTFERALARLDSYRPQRAPFAAWLFAIARNALADHLRAQRRHPWFSFDGWRNCPTGDPLPEESVVAAENRRCLLAAVAQLDERQRDLIGLKFGAGLGNQEIAGLTGLSEGNVGVILHRALSRLRELLGEKEAADELA